MHTVGDCPVGPLARGGGHKIRALGPWDLKELFCVVFAMKVGGVFRKWGVMGAPRLVCQWTLDNITKGTYVVILALLREEVFRMWLCVRLNSQFKHSRVVRDFLLSINCGVMRPLYAMEDHAHPTP